MRVFLHSFMRFWGEKNSSLQNASLFPTEPMNVFFRHMYPRAGARPLFHCCMFYLFLILFNRYLTRVATLSFTSLFQDGHGACVPLDCGRKPEDLEETHACTGRTRKRHAERIRPAGTRTQNLHHLQRPDQSGLGQTPCPLHSWPWNTQPSGSIALFPHCSLSSKRKWIVNCVSSKWGHKRVR